MGKIKNWSKQKGLSGYAIAIWVRNSPGNKNDSTKFIREKLVLSEVPYPSGVSYELVSHNLSTGGTDKIFRADIISKKEALAYAMKYMRSHNG